MHLKTGFLIFAFGFFHFTSAKTIERCHIDGKIVITEPSTIECYDPVLTVDEGSEIITNGYELDVVADGIIKTSACPSVHAFEPGSANKDARRIYIEAATLEGCLDLQTDGSLVLNPVSYKNFRFSAEAPGARPFNDNGLQVMANGSKVSEDQLKSIRFLR